MTIAGVIGYIFFQLLIPIIFVLSSVTFIWGLFLYFIAGGADEDLQGHGKTLMLYGLLVFLFMTILWWLLSMFVSPFL